MFRKNVEKKPASPATPRKYTLRLTLTFAFCGLTLLGTLFFSVVTSQVFGGFIREELRVRLSDVIKQMAIGIDADEHSKIKTVDDAKSEAFTKLQTQISDMRARGTGIANAYTMRKTEDGHIMFVVDGSEKDLSPTGEIYNDATKTLNEALNAKPKGMHAFTEYEPTADNFGTWLSAFAPLVTKDGRFDGVIGIDVSANTIHEHERNYQRAVYLLSIAVGFLMLPFGFFIARRIREPLTKLTLEMEKVRQFDLDGGVEIETRISEIDRMVRNLESMKRGLSSFKKYVPADLVRELMELGVDAELGGEKRNLTMFFSDVANFTSISEKLTPEELVSYLGEYLNVMNAALLHHHATVDKYIGDGVMAFWGAPRKVENPAHLACQAALECQKAIAALNDRWHAQGLGFAFHTRIGINTGEVIVGNMGSDERMSYTVIGDNVNLTSRVESANKFYGTSILITESTYEEVKDQFVARLVDNAVLAGKAIPIRLYELLGPKGEVAQEKLELMERYGHAFSLHSQRQFTEAMAILEERLSANPSDLAVKRLHERCCLYLESPPPPEWQGEFVLPGK